jgi:hypothetical protein
VQRIEEKIRKRGEKTIGRIVREEKFREGKGTDNNRRKEI